MWEYNSIDLISDEALNFSYHVCVNMDVYCISSLSPYVSFSFPMNCASFFKSYRSFCVVFPSSAGPNCCYTCAWAPAFTWPMIALGGGHRLILSQTGVSGQINTLAGHTSNINKHVDRWPSFLEVVMVIVFLWLVWRRQLTKYSVWANLVKLLPFKQKIREDLIRDGWMFVKQN